MQSSNYKKTKIEYRGNWKTVRGRILKRDNYECQIGLPGCTITAQTVDHITPIAWGGDPRDPYNLRAACTHCNAQLSVIAKKYKPRNTDTQPATKPANNDSRLEQPSRDW